MRRLGVGVALIALGFAGCPSPVGPGPCDVPWLIGAWSGQAGGEVLLQRWTRVDAHHLAGHFEVRGEGDQVEEERWDLRRRGERWVLDVALDDGSPLHFGVSECEPGRLRLHGSPGRSPQRITLQRAGPRLQVELEGRDATGLTQRTTLRLDRQR